MSEQQKTLGDFIKERLTDATAIKNQTELLVANRDKMVDQTVDFDWIKQLAIHIVTQYEIQLEIYRKTKDIDNLLRTLLDAKSVSPEDLYERAKTLGWFVRGLATPPGGTEQAARAP